MLKKSILVFDFILALVSYFSYLYNPLAPFSKGGLRGLS